MFYQASGFHCLFSIDVSLHQHFQYMAEIIATCSKGVSSGTPSNLMAPSFPEGGTFSADITAEDK